tara:strand:- start:5185 stop:5988 length:804 start_codon:yes stop_codon:yes gene_type:complete
MNTIILTVHNKENTIIKVLSNLLKNLSKKTIKIIIVLDGCNDATEFKINQFINSFKINKLLEIIHTDDIWETRANNIGLKKVNTKYATIVQDDMVIKQKNWDATLLNIFKTNDLFAVSGRTAHDFTFLNDHIIPINLFGREYPFSNNHLLGKLTGRFMRIFKTYWLYNYFNFYGIRLTVNRGPLILRMSKAKELRFFDEKFAPFELDDLDLCCRAYKKFGLFSAARPIFYTELNGSKKNNLDSQKVSINSIVKNERIIIQRHNDLAI